MKDITTRLEKLGLDLESMQLNATDWSTNWVANIDKYAQHVNHSMMTEISSCVPISNIAENTRAAVCDYTLDPFNGVWMAMAISLLLMLPIIMLSTSLVRLYARIHPFPKYIINEPSNEATLPPTLSMVQG
uniref:Uncharacterized protein n=1 Tax=Ditylenchus dipsaci TaxID=166011 RepID=A0A915EES4_9BILA